MKPSFTHYLITRYNVPLEGWEKDRQGASTRDEAWLEHRLKLFRSYCLPSVLAQTETQFTWLLYVDEQTPAMSRKALSETVKPYTFIRLKPVDGYDACLRDIDLSLKEAESAFVITSRLDNDDALGRNFIKTVQAHFVPNPGTILNLLHGHGYDHAHNVLTRLRHMRYNHFTSLIEARHPDGGHKSIRGFPHDVIPPGCTVVDIESDRSWLKLFHQRNLKSAPFGMPVFVNRVAEDYGLRKDSLEINLLNTVRYVAWWLPDGLKRKVSALFRQKKSSPR